jgi:integrase
MASFGITFVAPVSKKSRCRVCLGLGGLWRHSALASATPMMPSEIGASRTKPGTVAAAVAGYFASREFRELAPSTKYLRRGVLEKFRTLYGDGPIASLKRVHIERMLAEQSTAATALHFYVSIRELMKYAVRMGMRTDDPTQGIKRPKLTGGGFYAWTDDDIAKFETTHPADSRARLAMSLGLYLGQRRSDIFKLGWQHVRPDPQAPGRSIIRLRQQKTGEPLDIPVHPSFKCCSIRYPKLVSRSCGHNMDGRLEWVGLRTGSKRNVVRPDYPRKRHFMG